MFRFRRRVLDYLDAIDIETVCLRIQAEKINRRLEVLMSNQEVFDAYATQIAEQNRQIKAAVAAIAAQVADLKVAAVAATEEQPLDTTAMDEALAQLTAAVDEAEAIPAPVVEESPAVETDIPAE